MSEEYFPYPQSESRITMQRSIYFIVVLILIGADFAYLLVRHSLPFNTPQGGDVVHTALIVFAVIFSFPVAMRLHEKNTKADPTQVVWLLLLVAIVLLFLLVVYEKLEITAFILRNNQHVADGYKALIASSLLAILTTAAAVFVFTGMLHLLRIRQRKTTKRNLTFLYVLLVLSAFFSWLESPDGIGIRALGIPTDTLLVFTRVAVIINSFHHSWIASFERKKKYLHLFLTLSGCIVFLLLTIYYGESYNAGRSLLFFHPSVESFAYVSFFFVTIHMGVGFTRTLLLLPGAKEFDKKKADITSLRNLSRLTTQVLEPNELLKTISQLALETSNSDCAWVELLPTTDIPNTPSSDRQPETVIPDSSLRHITNTLIDNLRRPDGSRIQNLVLTTQEALYIQNLQTDQRIQIVSTMAEVPSSLAILPLSSRNTIIGLLCIGRKEAFGYDNEAIKNLCTLADIAAIAIENSRLVRASIAKGRLEQELLVARRMQQSLLPGSLPSSSHFDIAARSVAAHEVGGDYFDVWQDDNNTLSIVIGDVSGKSVSAALYMAQLKGAAQSIRQLNLSPREFISQLNTALWKNMERRSFISLLYCHVEIETGLLRFLRAGHCPLLYLHNGECNFLQPRGMALGLEGAKQFDDSLEEAVLHLTSGDTLMMFTDGITETHDNNIEEFGYDGLAEVLQRHNHLPARDMLNMVFETVQQYRGSAPTEDDRTAIVFRWLGNACWKR